MANTEAEIHPSEALRVAWSAVEKSRHAQRPHSLDYIHKIFEDFEEIRGDRKFSEDPELIAGMGILRGEGKQDDRKVFFLGHQKGRTTKQKIERNFGMARPEGYRKAMRLMDLADSFGRPVLTFIDTPGAFPGIGAEERGQSEAIAASILRMFKLKMPSISVVIGEGGSGGALAIGVADRLFMLENSTYSVISPESCAAILWSDAGEAKQAALALKLAAHDVHRLKLCDGVIREPGDGAHTDLGQTAELMRTQILSSLAELTSMDPSARLAARYEKYRRIDQSHLLTSSLQS